MYDLTEQFLMDMDDLFPNHGIWRMAETTSKTWVIEVDSYEKAMEFNSDKWKNWIFFSPNWDLRGKKKKNKEFAKNVYALTLDIDWWDLEWWKTFWAEPSIVIRTYRWYHLYWLLENPEEYSETFDQIEGFLVDDLWWDKNAKDVVRMYRVPSMTYRSTKHWEDNDWSFKILVEKYDPNIKYSYKDFTKYYEKFAKVISMNEADRKAVRNDLKNDHVFNDINNLNVVDVLNALTSDYQVNESTWRIYESWRITTSYRYYKSKNCLVRFNDEHEERPAGWPFSVAKHFLKDPKKVYEFFRNEFKIGWLEVFQYWYWWEGFLENMWERILSKDQSEGRKIIIPMPTGQLILSEENGVIRKADSKWKIEEVMKWCFFVKGYYYDEEKQINNYIIEYIKWDNSWTTYFSKLSKGNDLDGALSKIWLTYMGTAKDKMYLIEYIHSTKNKYTLINKLGVYNKWVIFTKPWMYEEEINGERFFVNASTQWSNNDVLEVSELITEEEFMDSVSNLWNMYKESIIYTLFTCFAMSLFVKQVRDQLWFCPTTVLVWLTQAGKTTARNTVCNMLGINARSCEIQASSSKFAIDVMCKNYLPVIAWEYENDALKFDRDTFLKNMYDWTTSLRGTADQKTIKYEVNGMMFIDGETRSMASSVYTRSINLHMNPSYKKWLIKTHNISWYLIDNYSKINQLRAFYQTTLEEVKIKFKDVDKQEKDRIIQNYSLLVAFAKCMWFAHIVEEALLEQCQSQFNMMGSDSLETSIRQIINQSNVSIFKWWMSSWFERVEWSDEYNLCILFSADIMSFNEKKYSDILSTIKTINHHFSEGRESSEDLIKIPVSFILKTKSLHSVFNEMLNKRIMLWNKDTISNQLAENPKLRSAILMYSDANQYRHYRFHWRIADFDSNIYNKQMRDEISWY